MQKPFFFEENILSEKEFSLSEETSRHIVQVLRMKEGAALLLTDGKGCTKVATIISADKKRTQVKINHTSFSENVLPKVTIAISLIKNITRFEWFLEKATETGVSAIIPFVSNRTEKQHLRLHRMKNILVSAMLQSQQSWLPDICEPVMLKDIFHNSSYSNKYIAHCMDGEKKQLSDDYFKNKNSIILIGPEGDFTNEEVSEAIENNFIPVSLGETRLRTETAGLVAAVLLLYKKI